MINTGEPIKKTVFGNKLHYSDPPVMLEAAQNPRRETLILFLLSEKEKT